MINDSLNLLSFPFGQSSCSIFHLISNICWFVLISSMKFGSPYFLFQVCFSLGELFFGYFQFLFFNNFGYCILTFSSNSNFTLAIITFCFFFFFFFSWFFYSFNNDLTMHFSASNDSYLYLLWRRFVTGTIIFPSLFLNQVIKTQLQGTFNITPYAGNSKIFEVTNPDVKHRNSIPFLYIINRT